MILDIKKILPLLGVQHGMTVMDMGSSTGFWVKPLAHIVGPTGKVIAVDYHADSVQRLSNDVKELGMEYVHAITGDIHNLGNLAIKKGSCDRVLLIQMLPIVEGNISDRMSELLEFLKPGGKLIVIDRVHYEDEVISYLRNNTDVTFEEISEVKDRSDRHFFGMMIMSRE